MTPKEVAEEAAAAEAAADKTPSSSSHSSSASSPSDFSSDSSSDEGSVLAPSAAANDVVRPEYAELAECDEKSELMEPRTSEKLSIWRFGPKQLKINIVVSIRVAGRWVKQMNSHLVCFPEKPNSKPQYTYKEEFSHAAAIIFGDNPAYGFHKDDKYVVISSLPRRMTQELTAAWISGFRQCGKSRFAVAERHLEEAKEDAENERLAVEKAKEEAKAAKAAAAVEKREEKRRAAAKREGLKREHDAKRKRKLRLRLRTKVSSDSLILSSRSRLAKCKDTAKQRRKNDSVSGTEDKPSSDVFSIGCVSDDEMLMTTTKGDFSSDSFSDEDNVNAEPALSDYDVRHEDAKLVEGEEMADPGAGDAVSVPGIEPKQLKINVVVSVRVAGRWENKKKTHLICFPEKPNAKPNYTYEKEFSQAAAMSFGDNLGYGFRNLRKVDDNGSLYQPDENG